MNSNLFFTFSSIPILIAIVIRIIVLIYFIKLARRGIKALDIYIHNNDTSQQ